MELHREQLQVLLERDYAKVLKLTRVELATRLKPTSLSRAFPFKF